MPYRSLGDLDEGTLEEGSRTCRACGTRKPMHAFSWVGKAKKYRFRKCSECCTAEAKSRRNKDPESAKLNAFKRHLRLQYGISYETYLKILAYQDNACAICREDLTEPHLDHCHDTGKVRGILCFTCNTALGKFKDSVEVLKSAIWYLQRPELSLEYIPKYLTAEEKSELARVKRATQGSERTRKHSESVQGIRNGNALLNDEIVRSIKVEYAAGGITQQALADRYNVSQQLINRIMKGKTWTHVLVEG